MECPACGEMMIGLELKKIEIDYCLNCRGIWLDEGELELLTGNASFAQDMLDSSGPAGKTKEKKRRCPICRKKMKKMMLKGENPTTYDVCPIGDGLWFDGNELEEVLKSGMPGEGGKVTEFLRDVFGAAEGDSVAAGEESESGEKERG